MATSPLEPAPNESTAPASVQPHGEELESATTADRAGRLSRWNRPVSYRAQCWIAWAGLTAFGIRGVVSVRSGEGLDLERMAAVVLSLAWGIDLLRGRSAER